MTDLRVSNLVKSFGTQRVLDGVDLYVQEGSLTAILGPSGSGKTTLLRIIAGFERSDQGEVSIGGRVVDDSAHSFVRPDKRRIGYVPQEGALFPHLSVGRNVAFGLDKSVRRSGVVGNLLRTVGLGGLAKRYPHQLSGGQQQRVALARALAIEPELLLLDEPFSSLDASLRASVRADVLDIIHRAGTTAILVTHDQDEALSMAEHVAIIRDGKIGQVDSPERAYTHPNDPDIAGFLGDANLIEGKVDGASVDTVFGKLDLLENGAEFREGELVTVLVRPEQISLRADPQQQDLKARVLSYEYFGHDAVVHVVIDDDQNKRDDDRPIEMIVRVRGANSWHPGSQVGVTAKGRVFAWAGSRPKLQS